MSKIKFVHTADLHLDTPFKGLTHVDDQLANKLKDATFKAFENIVNTCITENVNFLLIAGDTFDSEESSLKSQFFFTKQLERLHAVDIQVYMICGNHDPLPSWSQFIKLPDNTTRFEDKSVGSVTYIKNGEELAEIYGISFGKKDIKENLSLRYNKNRKQTPFSIALLHGTSGKSDKHANYAPFTTGDLTDKGFDYWALGHIHKWEILQEAEPAIVYSGNPQGRDFGETGPRGSLMVELETGKPPNISFFDTASLILDYLTINIEGIESQEYLFNLINQNIKELSNTYNNRSLILRLNLSGRTPMHAMLKDTAKQAELIDIINEQLTDTGPFCRIDHLQAQTMPTADLGKLAEANDFTGDLLRTIKTYQKHPDIQNELIDKALDGFKPTHLGRLLNNLTEEEKKTIMEQAKWILINELVKE